jgi:hypothetical protein
MKDNDSEIVACVVFWALVVLFVVVVLGCL